MKNLIFIILFFGIAMLYFGCADNNSLTPALSQDDQVTNSLDKKPAPKLNCTTDYDFVAGLGIYDNQGRLLVWQGTTSGDINGIIKWWTDMATMWYTGQASHYEDRFEIWNAEETMLLLAGDEAGSTTARHGNNSNWRTNGTVTEGYGEYEDWLGCNTHAEGHFTWAAPGVPDHGDGTFRIN